MRTKIIGGGLAGCEAAYQLLKRGIEVDLYEMRPKVNTLAHQTNNLAELVCSNSLKSILPLTAQALLKEELRLFDSIILNSAEKNKIPAGASLAVNRDLFSQTIEQTLFSFPNFHLIREEFYSIDDYSIISTGPLTSSKMVQVIERELGKRNLYFYDAISPIVSASSIDFNKAFWASRYGKGDADYLNCPLSKENYINFCQQLVSAERVLLRSFEGKELFGACLPIEEIARKGIDSLRYGPMRPVGITDSENNKFYAVVQLRRETKEGDTLNLVGFQTNLKYFEQKRILSIIPALKNVEFYRYGQMHKNTYINSPEVLTTYGNMQKRNKVFFAGQITGVEGYLESTASGLVAGINMYKILRGEEPIKFPANSLIGSLMGHISLSNDNYQPMNANYGLLFNEQHEKFRRNERRSVINKESITCLKQLLPKTL